MCIRDRFSILVRDTVRDGGVTFLLPTGIALFDDDLSSFTAWRRLADGISRVLAGDEIVSKPLFGEVAEVYRNGVNRLANQPTKRFHPERFLYSSLVNRVPVSYTHLDVYKRQAFGSIGRNLP